MKAGDFAGDLTSNSEEPKRTLLAVKEPDILGYRHVVTPWPDARTL